MGQSTAFLSILSMAGSPLSPSLGVHRRQVYACHHRFAFCVWQVHACRHHLNVHTWQVHACHHCLGFTYGRCTLVTTAWGSRTAGPRLSPPLGLSGAAGPRLSPVPGDTSNLADEDNRCGKVDKSSAAVEAAKKKRGKNGVEASTRRCIQFSPDQTRRRVPDGRFWDGVAVVAKSVFFSPSPLRTTPDPNPPPPTIWNILIFLYGKLAVSQYRVGSIPIFGREPVVDVTGWVEACGIGVRLGEEWRV